jgi:hypothetical protein
MDGFVNEASDFDNRTSIYTEEENSNDREDDETSSVSGKYTTLNHSCFKIGYNCHITSVITSFKVLLPCCENSICCSKGWCFM